jgi:hypothetical protein
MNAAKMAQLQRIYDHARSIWGPGDYSVAVDGRTAALRRAGEELSRVGTVASWLDPNALDALEGALRRRAADMS